MTGCQGWRHLSQDVYKGQFYSFPVFPLPCVLYILCYITSYITQFICHVEISREKQLKVLMWGFAFISVDHLTLLKENLKTIFLIF